MTGPRDKVPQVPANLGPCVGLTLLGAGAMGAVYRARHTRLGLDVAVKVVNPRLGANDPKLFQRFLREVELLRGVEDPHVVRILDSGQEGAFVFAVMELVLGKTLGKIKAEAPEQRLAPDAVAYYLEHIARGLAAVHEKGIVHRDIKPDNVMVDATGTAKIMDFGLARGQGSQQLTMMDEVVGTPEYMAPEVIQHTELDGRADLYSLGITGYELLTGATPFNQGGLMRVVQDHVQRQPVPIDVKRPGVPPGLVQVVSRLLEKDPGRRYATAAEAAEALARFSAKSPPHRPVTDQPAYAKTPPARPAPGPAPGPAPAPAGAAAPAGRAAGAPPAGALPGAAAKPTSHGWGAQARTPAPAPTARPGAAPGPAGAAPAAGLRATTPATPAGPEVPLLSWEDLAVLKLLARHGILPLDDLLDRARAYLDPARAGGAPSFPAFLIRTAGLPARTAQQAVDAAGRGLAALRGRIAHSLLSRAGRVPAEALGRAAREAAGKPFVPALVERGLLRPDEGAALEARVEEALRLARERAVAAARGAGGPDQVRRQALRNLLDYL